MTEHRSHLITLFNVQCKSQVTTTFTYINSTSTLEVPVDLWTINCIFINKIRRETKLKFYKCIPVLILSYEMCIRDRFGRLLVTILLIIIRKNICILYHTYIKRDRQTVNIGLCIW